MKIFLDIGSHHGETLVIICQKKYAFDKIYCFEPIKENHLKLRKIKRDDKKIVLNEYGLFSESCKKIMYNPGNVGSSIFKEKLVSHPNNRTERCKFIKASNWFKDNLSTLDEIYAKINIEGAEIEVLNDLLDSGEFHKLKKVIITFDVLKIPGKEYLKEQMLTRFKNEGITNFSVLRDLRDQFQHLKETDKMNKVYDIWLGIK